MYEAILNAFYNEMAGNVTMERPYMVGPGNHEANCDNGGAGSYTDSICVEGQTNFTGFRNHFRMPSAQSGGLENFWYSWDYGLAHYIQFNTETDVSLNNAHLAKGHSANFLVPWCPGSSWW